MAKRDSIEQPNPEPSHPVTAYEVRCDACEVSYPIGTKRCMYCGGRPGQQALFTRDLQPDPMVEFQPIFGSESVSQGGSYADDEVEQPRGTLFRLLGNLSWILLFVAITVYRSCTG